MTDFSIDLVTTFVISGVLALMSGMLSYYAWLRPTQYQSFLRAAASFFKGWPLGVQALWESSFYFWLIRLTCLLAFGTTVSLFIYALVGLVRTAF